MSFGFDGRDDAEAGVAGMRGVAVGVVTDNEDPEGLGRVRLEFPWRDAEDTSDWARIATPMAGDGTGTYFLPEVGDEVLVAFENGDVRYPYVLGALWNGEDRPPAENEGDNDLRTIRSRSGHEITLDDDDREGRLTVRSAGGHEVVLDDSTGSETITVTDSAGQEVLVVEATGTVTLGAGATLKLEAPMLELAADGNLTVEAGGVLTLKGALVKIN
ncbi:MAG: phage baseplate assembly protein V [Haloarculaceae archaeon]